MTAQRRNFWIFLTVLAIGVTMMRFSDGQRKHKKCHRAVVKECHMKKKRSCSHHERVLTETQDVPSINDFVFVHEAPQALNLDDVMQQIRYPEEARGMFAEGKVVLRILVDEEGNYRAHRVMRTDHPAFSAAVEPHVAALKFDPALRDGRHVKYWVNIPFSFKLD